MEFFEPRYPNGKDFNTLFDLVKHSHLSQSYSGATVCDALVVRAGRPYYKVWPEYVDLFMKSKLEAIPMSLLEFPFPAFEIRLGKPVESVGTDFSAGAVQVAMYCGSSPREMLTTKPPRSINDASGIAITIAGSGDSAEREVAYVMHFGPGHRECTVEQFIESAVNHVQLVDGKFEDKDSLRQHLSEAFRLVVSLVFLATGQHYVINPDVINADISKLWEAVGRGDQATIDKLADRAARRRQGSRGFTVGKFHAINIPRQSSSGSVAGDCEVARELRHQHMRSAHWRVQRVGAGRTQCKVVFIAPTIVRPDLPVSSSQQDRRVH